MGLPLNDHISAKYNKDLSDLHHGIILMGAMVEEQVSDCLQSLFHADIPLAKAVIERDHIVNQIELEISQHCAEIIALREPTARDLRLILAVEKSITDLERIGDLAENIAKLSKKLIKTGVSTHYYSDIRSIGDEVQKMLKNTLDTFARVDVESAINTMSASAKIHKKSVELSRVLIVYMTKEPHIIKPLLRVLDISKHLERIACHCENLCEYTVYLVKGEDIRYQNLDRIRHQFLAENDDGNEM